MNWSVSSQGSRNRRKWGKCWTALPPADKSLINLRSAAALMNKKSEGRNKYVTFAQAMRLEGAFVVFSGKETTVFHLLSATVKTWLLMIAIWSTVHVCVRACARFGSLLFMIIYSHTQKKDICNVWACTGNLMFRGKGTHEAGEEGTSSLSSQLWCFLGCHGSQWSLVLGRIGLLIG